MPFVSTGHIWLLAILLVIVLIIWGPGKLPDVGSGMGRAIREFRKASNETREEFSKATRGDDSATAAAATPVATPAATEVPAVPAVPVTSAPAQPAPLGGGPVPGAPLDSDPR
jgi:TatA/E family protein of Tat protein translocase